MGIPPKSEKSNHIRMTKYIKERNSIALGLSTKTSRTKLFYTFHHFRVSIQCGTHLIDVKIVDMEQ